jgi:multidrug efflux pump subunit AcrB
LSHHRHKPKKKRPSILVRLWNGFFDLFANGLNWFIGKVYRPSLDFATSWRYLTVAGAVTTLLLTFGLIGGGIVQFVFLPEVEADYVVGSITLPQETPATVTAEAVRRMEESALELQKQLEEEVGGSVFRHVLTSVGEQPFRVIQSRNSGDLSSTFLGSHIGEVDIELVPAEERGLSSSQIAARWRELTGPIPGAVELTFSADLIGGGKDIDIQLAGHDTEQLRRLSGQIKTKLAEYPGVIDISDSFRGGKPEVKLAINPKAEALGLSLSDLARQVRQGFYGEEAQRIQRGRDDVRVMVRYPEEERKSLGDLERMRIRTPAGAEAPFSTVANAQFGRGFATITRVDRRRTINVTADVDAAQGNANEILADLGTGFLPQLVSSHPGVTYTFEGQQREQMEALDGLFRGFLVALFVIYALMAVPFKSYLQPLIVMSAVPFGVVGAVWGHVLMGMSMSILSLCGVVALTGIVVNDSLVLVDYINGLRRSGVPLWEAVHEAGLTRFRPILLTSLTTAAGITPLMLERSVQARFLVPMAVALAFGVLFSTFITLVLVPAGYIILEDLNWLFRKALGWQPSELVRPEQPGAVGKAEADEDSAAEGITPGRPRPAVSPAFEPQMGTASSPVASDGD